MNMWFLFRTYQTFGNNKAQIIFSIYLFRGRNVIRPITKTFIDPVTYQQWDPQFSFHQTVQYFLGRHNLTSTRSFCKVLERLKECQTQNSTEFSHKIHNCTILTLENLVNPQWVLVDCNEREATVIFCQTDWNPSLSELEMAMEVHPRGPMCLGTSLFVNNSCWSNAPVADRQPCLCGLFRTLFCIFLSFYMR